MRAGRNYQRSNTAHRVASLDAHRIVDTTHEERLNSFRSEFMERAEASQRKMNLPVSSPTDIMNSSMGEAPYEIESFIVNPEETPLPPLITDDSVGSIEVKPLPALSNTRDFGVVESAPKHLHGDSVVAAESIIDKHPSLLDNTRDNEVVESAPEHHDND